MKAHILYNDETPDIDELSEYFDLELQYTPYTLKTVHNPYFNEIWGDFNWLRSLFTKPCDIRCFATAKEHLQLQGITHLGLYDLVDRDNVIDFYIGVPSNLDKRAKKNGFRTNFAWLFVHEYLHGREQGGPDRVHAMEAQGRLKELLEEYRVKDLDAQVVTLRKVVISLLERLLKSLQ